jgi:hypothetical protein
MTAIGIILETAGFTLGLFEAVNSQISTILFAFGWPLMVTGFSLVLYSRLHLIVYNPLLNRIVLIFIVGDAILVQFPVFLFAFIGAPRYVIFLKVAKFLSHFEIIFSVQELVLSTLYIYFFRQFVKQGGSMGSKNLQRTFYLLIAAEVIIVVCDLTINITLYLNLYIPRKIILPFVYAIKLQIEFLVLNRLAGSRQGVNAQLQDHDADLDRRTTSRNVSSSLKHLLSSRSSPAENSEKCTEPSSPLSLLSSLNESTKQNTMLEDAMVSVAPRSYRKTGKIQGGDVDSY